MWKHDSVKNMWKHDSKSKDIHPGRTRHVGTCNVQKREKENIRNFIMPTNTFMKTLLIGTYLPLKKNTIQLNTVLEYFQILTTAGYLKRFL
jgi:hypothetical protein